ncbi:MAG: hypothetical protein R3E53_03450 [Myxococcota bacterium]
MGFGLDPLASVVRLLADGRVGHHPDAIPVDASVRDYLERIIARPRGSRVRRRQPDLHARPLEATKAHDKARGLLASEGLSEQTIAAIRAAGSAYGRAIDLAQTPSGQAAVYIRVLRQMGEVYAAKQRLGVDPDVEIPFTIEGALQVYGMLHEARDGSWRGLGFRSSGYESYLESMRTLWEEIQEATLNSADYYLARALEDPARAPVMVRNASRLYARYLAHFERYATADATDFVPDSAYFAAYEAARGYGDGFVAYGVANASPAEIQLAVERYQLALRAFPFDRNLWPSLTTALERRGRANDFLAIARPIAEVVAGSRHASAWVAQNGAGSPTIEVFRRGLGDELVLMYMGFADATGLSELEKSLDDLRTRRAALSQELEALAARRELDGAGSPPAPAGDDGPVRFGTASRRRSRELEDGGRQLAKLDKDRAARARALPSSGRSSRARTRSGARRPSTPSTPCFDCSTTRSIGRASRAIAHRRNHDANPNDGIPVWSGWLRSLRPRSSSAAPASAAVRIPCSRRPISRRSRRMRPSVARRSPGVDSTSTAPGATCRASTRRCAVWSTARTAVACGCSTTSSASTWAVTSTRCCGRCGRARIRRRWPSTRTCAS